LEQGLAPLPEPGPVGTLRFPQRVAEPVQVEPPRPELASALVLASWTELEGVPWQDRVPELPSVSPALEQAKPRLLLRVFWPVRVP
jgi:hypothetical protein